MSPPFWSTIDTGYVNPYTCRLFKRIDAMLWRLRGKRVFWGGPNSGRLCERMPAGHGVELRSHFPASWYLAACNLQNRHLWTRRVLSL